MSIPQEQQIVETLYCTVPFLCTQCTIHFSVIHLFFCRFYYSAYSRTKDELMRPISGIYQISNSVHSDLIGSIFSKFLWMAEIAVVSLCGGGQLKNILLLFAFFVANMEKNGKFINSRSKLKIYLN